MEPAIHLVASLGRVRSRNGTLRAPATVMFADKPLKGFRFSRDEIARSIPKWIGDPVAIGNHNRAPNGNIMADFSPGAENPPVGEVKDAMLDDTGRFRLVAEFNDRLKTELQRRGFERLEDLPGEVSLEMIPYGEPGEDGITDAEISHTNGFVLLTEQVGACSRADGCGLFANTCNCADCKEEDTLDEKARKELAEQVAKATAAAVGEAFKPIADALKASSGDGQNKSGDGDQKGADTKPKGDGTSANLDELKAKAEAHDKMIEAQRKSVIDRLVATGRYSDADRERLAKVDVEELRERLTLIGGEEETRLAASAELPTALHKKQPESGDAKNLTADSGHKILSWEDKVAKMRATG